MRRAAVTAIVLISILTGLAHSLANDPTALHTSPGTGLFLMISDVHFDPYDNPSIMERLGAKPQGTGCPAPSTGAFSKLGSDTNYPLFKSMLENVAATAAANHLRYDYVLVSGDLLAHNFDLHYRQCVGGAQAAGQKFAIDTISFVDSMIAKALPGVPIFAALGNNDSDSGDYARPTSTFLSSVGRDWSHDWGALPSGVQTVAHAKFDEAGYYAVPHPTVAHHELVVLNSNLWSARNAEACGDGDPDPGGQIEWLGQVLADARRERRTATVIMHIVPGADAMKSSLGAPESLWTEACTRKIISELSDYRGVVREIYAGHIHRDDFRIFPDRDGEPLLPVHIAPSVSPVYFNNPAVEIGWYDKHTGDLADYAPLYLDLANSAATWTTEYLFSRAYGGARPNLSTLVKMSREIHDGNPDSGIGKQYTTYYGVGVSWFVTRENWLSYTCTHTAITLASYAQCKSAAVVHP